MRRLIWTALALGIVVIVGAWFLKPRIDERLRSEVVRQLETALGGSAHLGELNIEWWSLSAEFADLQVEVQEDGERLLAIFIVRGRIGIGWAGVAGLYIGSIDLDEVYLDQPYVELDQRFLGKGSDEPRPVDFSIERLALRQGRFLYDDREVPLELEATTVRVDALWSRPLRSLSGFGGAKVAIDLPPLENRLELDLNSRFTWRDRSIRLFQTRAQSQAVRFSGSAVVEWENERRIHAEGTALADLGEVTRLLSSQIPEMTGEMEAQLRFDQLANDPWTLRGDFQSGATTVERIQARFVAGRADVDPTAIRLDVRDAGAFGGRAQGQIDIGIQGPSTLAFDLKGTDLSAADLFAYLNLPVPLKGSVNAALRLAGPANNSMEWVGQGEFEVRAPSKSPSLMDTSGIGTFELDHGKLAVHAEQILVSDTSLNVELAADLNTSPSEMELQLDGTTQSASRTKQGTLEIMRAFGVTPPEILQQSLTGKGPIRSTLRVGADVALDLALDLTDGSFLEHDFDRAELDLQLDGDSLKISTIKMQSAAQQLAGSATLDIESGSLQELYGEFEKIDLAALSSEGFATVDFAGTADGSIQLFRGPGGLSGVGNALIRDGALAGQDFESLEATVQIENDAVRISAWSLAAIGVQARGQASASLQLGSWKIDLDRADLDLATWPKIAGAELDLAGQIQFTGAIEGDGQTITASIPLTGQNLKAYGQTLGNFDGRLALDSDRIQFELNGPEDLGWRASGTAGLSEDVPLDINVALNATPLEPGLSYLGDAELYLTGNLHWTGPGIDPTLWVLDGMFDTAQFWVGNRSLTSTAAFPLTLSAGQLRTGPLVMEGPGGRLESELRYDVPGDTIELRSKGTLGLALLSGVVPDLRASGGLTLDLRADGKLEDIVFRGEARVDDGRLRWLGLGQTVEHLDVAAQFAGGRIKFDKISASIGGGDVDGTGEVALRGFDVENFGFEFAADAVRLRFPEGFEGIYRGNLLWNGTEVRSLVRGDLTLDRGLYREEFDLSSLLGIGVREYAGDDPLDLPGEIGLDVRIVSPGNVWVRNELAQVETTVNLELGGTVDRPELTGRIGLLEGGEIDFRNVEYRIESGSLDFVELSRLDPYLTLRARTAVKNYDVLLVVNGTLDNFEYELTSTPTLSQQDIIALLTTGSTLQELTAGRSGGAAFTGDLAANYFAGALTGRFEKQLQTALGLERIEINPLLVEGDADPTTRITLGKEVADDLFVIVSSDLGRTERQVYQIEWRASRKLRLKAQRDTTGGIGGDVEYTNRFWLRRKEHLAAKSVTESSVAIHRLGEIYWEGLNPDEIANLVKRIPLKKGERFQRAEMFESVDLVRRSLIRDGRIEAQIRATAEVRADDETVTDVRFEIEPGPKLTIVFEGVRGREARKLRSALEQTWVESLFEVDLYEDSARIVREFFQDRGYYTVDVQVESRPDAIPPEVVFLVDKGKPVTIQAVEFTGTGELGEDRVQRQMLSRPSGLLSRRFLKPDVLDSDIKAIRNLYRDQGFLDVAVAEPQIQLSTSGESATVKIAIDAGRRFRIQSMTFDRFEPFDEEQLRRWSGLEQGETFSRSKLFSAESGLRAAMDERGYPGARVRGRYENNENGVNVQFELDTGSLMRVGEIRVAGNRRTKEYIIRREFDMEPGDLISRERILQLQHRLYLLGIFSNVRISYEPVVAGEPEQIVLVQVDEAAPLSFNVAAGFDSEAGGRLGLGVTHGNLLGRDRELSFQTFLSGLESRYQIVAREPRLFGLKYPVLFRLAYDDRTETGFDVLRRGAAIRIDRKFDKRWSAFLRYNLQEVDLRNVDDALRVREDKLENLRLGDVGLAVVRDGRDDPFVTLNGNYASLDARFFARPLLSQATFSKTVGQFSWYRTYPAGFGWASSVRLGVANPFNQTNRVPLSERFFAGGDSSLRGFRRDEVGPQQDGAATGGEGMFLFNQEFRFPIWRQLRGVLFYDGGNVYESLDDLDPTDLRHVLGGGLRVETPIGPIRFEYGAKLDRRLDESKGEFFIAIGSAF